MAKLAVVPRYVHVFMLKLIRDIMFCFFSRNGLFFNFARLIRFSNQINVIMIIDGLMI